MTTPQPPDHHTGAPADAHATAGSLLPASAQVPASRDPAADPFAAEALAGRPIAAAAPSAPRSPLGAFNELMTRPLALVQRGRGDGRLGAGRLFAGALACYVLYGVAAGCFAGGPALALAAVKAPLIVGLTFLLC